MMVFLPSNGALARARVGAGLLASLCLFATDVSALECSEPFQVRQSFANGAAWEMCWEEQAREGMVLRDVTYTSPAGVARRVLYQANVAQIHVPYDDDGARYHDVSDFGLGGTRLNDLTPADCPVGTLISNEGKDVFCKTLHDAATLATESEVRHGEALSLFSVSHVGAYNYVPEWRFFDDGTIEPAMGATGRLQRYSDSEIYGWPVRTGASPVGVSHIHNYYWRLDFDLDGGDDDRFQELEFVDGANGTRMLTSTSFTNEAARSVNPATQRFWRVHDAGSENGAGRAISYDILPLETGHRDIGPSFEPWTFNDIYATTYRACERFVSHNPADSADGCAANGNVTDFVSGESIDTSDLVVWFGLTFHHTPRDEDEAYMNAHWNRFRLEPRDWLGAGASNAFPVLEPIADQQNRQGDVVGFSALATDIDGEALTYTASGLPTGVDIDAAGHISGTLSIAGNYSVTVTVSDPQNATATSTFSWTVSVAPETGCADCTDFVAVATLGYGRQDFVPGVRVEEVGATLALHNNTWRRASETYTITANTMLEFEFKSTAEGEIHGIGFDNDNVLSQVNIFQLYGTQDFGIQTFNNYFPPGYVLYQIPVGEYYTGADMALVFVNDHDSGSGNTSYFRNVRVYEAEAETGTIAAPSSSPAAVGTITNLALGGLAHQSSTMDLGLNFSAANAVDGNTGGNFPGDDIAHTNLEDQPWWEVDLGAIYDLSSILVFNREDCCAEGFADFHVFVSEVPFSTTTVAGTLAQSGVSTFFVSGPGDRETDISLNRRGRYVRVQLAQTEYLQIAEVEVMGRPQ